MEEEKSEKEKKIDSIVLSYYSRKDIQEAIFQFSRNRETIARNFDFFSKRPDSLEYPSDVINQVKKGFSSFHCSQELWSNPLELSTELSLEKLNVLRTGWDLLIDIDSKYLDYSKLACQLIIDALEHHRVKNYGLKFSGGKGFHILVPCKAFPKEINNQLTKNLFPEIPRAITSYLKELINKKLVDRISDLTMKDRKNYVNNPEEALKVIPDLVLVSSRHLFRCPYSLHEKGMVSVVIDKSELASFEPKLADPLRVKIKNFYPQAEENEARELLLSALDWSKTKEVKEKREYKEISVDRKNLAHPPCISSILSGLADGKKRALFILINYFRSLGFEFEELAGLLDEWNKKNKPPLKQGYITSQLAWSQRQKKMLPPNCDKDYYKGIGVCQSDQLCEKIKNPVNYAVRKQRR